MLEAGGITRGPIIVRNSSPWKNQKTHNTIDIHFHHLKRSPGRADWVRTSVRVAIAGGGVPCHSSGTSLSRKAAHSHLNAIAARSASIILAETLHAAVATSPAVWTISSPAIRTWQTTASTQSDGSRAETSGYAGRVSTTRLRHRSRLCDFDGPFAEYESQHRTGTLMPPAYRRYYDQDDLA